MDASGVGGIQDAVAISMLKKSMDIEKQTAMQLIEAIPSAPATPAPTSNLGHNIDIKA